MVEERQVSHTEFQIIYVYDLPSRIRNVTPHSEVWAVHSDFLPKCTELEVEKKRAILQYRAVSYITPVINSVKIIWL